MDETERPAEEGAPKTPEARDVAETAVSAEPVAEKQEPSSGGESKALTPTLSRGEREEAPVAEGPQAGDVEAAKPPVVVKRRASLAERVREPEEAPIACPAATVRGR